MFPLQWVVDGVMAFGVITMVLAGYEKGIYRRGHSCTVLTLYVVWAAMVIPLPIYILVAGPSASLDQLFIVGIHALVGLVLVVLSLLVTPRVVRLVLSMRHGGSE